MAAAGGGGGGNNYPPDWAVFEIVASANNDDVANVAPILAHGSYANVQELLDNINSLIVDEKDTPGKCHVFTKPLESLEGLLPYEDEDGIETTTYLAVSKSAGVIGYISVEQKLGIDSNIFTHVGLEVEALVNKIGWTCSFTLSPVQFRGKSVRDHIAPLAETYKINMGKYIADQVCAKLLEKLYKTVRETKHINTVILFSVGTQEARPRHRKNGKLSACRFLEEWINDDDTNIMEYYDHNEFSAGLMYYYYMPDQQFIGSDLYRRFLETGSDISKLRSAIPKGDKNVGLRDVDYACPSGLSFDKFYTMISEGRPYEMIESGHENKRTRLTGGFSKKKSSSRFTIKRTRGRRRAYGRPSRRRGSN